MEAGNGSAPSPNEVSTNNLESVRRKRVSAQNLAGKQPRRKRREQKMHAKRTIVKG
jgi:hypothetical protein